MGADTGKVKMPWLAVVQQGMNPHPHLRFFPGSAYAFFRCGSATAVLTSSILRCWSILPLLGLLKAAPGSIIILQPPVYIFKGIFWRGRSKLTKKGEEIKRLI
jgi:hypothetical protein